MHQNECLNAGLFPIKNTFINFSDKSRSTYSHARVRSWDGTPSKGGYYDNSHSVYSREDDQKECIWGTLYPSRAISPDGETLQSSTSPYEHAVTYSEYDSSSEWDARDMYPIVSQHAESFETPDSRDWWNAKSALKKNNYRFIGTWSDWRNPSSAKSYIQAAYPNFGKGSTNPTQHSASERSPKSSDIQGSWSPAEKESFDTQGIAYIENQSFIYPVSPVKSDPNPKYPVSRVKSNGHNPNGHPGSLKGGKPDKLAQDARPQILSLCPLLPDTDNIRPIGVTTLMVRNIPAYFSQMDLLDDLDSAGYTPNMCFDYFYLPVSFTTRKNLGYAFVNCTSTTVARSFMKDFHCQRFPRYDSIKTLEVTPAASQGLSSNVGIFMHGRSKRIGNPYFRPYIWIDGERKALTMESFAEKLRKDAPNLDGALARKYENSFLLETDNKLVLT